MIVDKPWGWEEIFAKTDKYVGKILHINAGHRLSLQYHEKKEETIKVLNGKLKDQGLDSFILGPGEVYHITPYMIHRMGSEGGDCEVVEVSTSELDDVVRLEDDYKRK